MVGFNLVSGAAALIGNYVRGSFAIGLIVFVVLESLPLWWRRRFPLLVLAVIAFVEIAKWAFGFSNEPSGPALVFAVYAVSAYSPPRARLVVAGMAIAVLVLAVALLIFGDFPISRNLIPAGALSLVAWVIGDYIRSRRRFFAELVERHEQGRRQAAEAERLRIARELHDVVAHKVSLIAIQAGAARVSGNADRDTFKSIEDGARDTLAELNKLLGVLRKTPGGPELAPQPSLDDVEELLRPLRDAGVVPSLRITGVRHPLPAAVDLSAYRIVQESLTNVLKHANATRVEIYVDYAPGEIQLTVSDNGSGPGDTAANGHGLIGMRERVDLFGGELQTGTSRLGGFSVHARLPLGR